MLRIVWSSQRQGVEVGRTGNRGTGLGAKVVTQAGGSKNRAKVSPDETAEVDWAALCVLGDGK